MLSLLKPKTEAIERFLEQSRWHNFSYKEVGATQAEPLNLRGYKIDHNRVQLGTGVETLNRAVSAVRDWKMFEFPWVKIMPVDASISSGQTVSVLAQHLGCFSLNACRIVYTIDELDDGITSGEGGVPASAATLRFGFAYGTLKSHMECGEERFLIEYKPEDQSVWYDILAFSRPGSIVSIAGYPLARLFQKRFVEASKSAMLAAVK